MVHIKSDLKRKLKFSNIINIIVVIMVVGLFLYLCFSDNGLVDLIMRPDALNLFWIIMAALCQLINLTLEAYLVYRFTHHHEKSYTIKQSIKTAMVGQFFGAITPAAAGLAAAGGPFAPRQSCQVRGRSSPPG